MRKKEKQEKKNRAFIVFILVIFLVSSLGSVVIDFGGSGTDSFTLTSSSGEKYKFKAETDSAGNQYYLGSSGENKFISYYNPSQLSIDVSDTAKKILKESNIFYITFDPEQNNLNILDYLRYDIEKNIVPSKLQINVITKESLLYELPVITCENATLNSPVIEFKNSNLTNISVTTDYCISAEFNSNTALQVRDALVYMINGLDIR
ncbi:MAG: hypothetical protein AABW92_03150 [Nanoarchaeota archaeon]